MWTSAREKLEQKELEEERNAANAGTSNGGGGGGSSGGVLTTGPAGDMDEDTNDTSVSYATRSAAGPGSNKADKGDDDDDGEWPTN